MKLMVRLVILSVAGMVLAMTAQADRFACEPKTPISLDDLTAEAEAVLIGEFHGTAEMPGVLVDTVEAALKSKRQIVVALEYSADWQDDLDMMLRIDPVEAESVWAEHSTSDGRTSAAMRDMLMDLMALARENPKIYIVAVDRKWEEPKINWQAPDWWPEDVGFDKSERDYAMGANALRACADAACDLLIYYAGNIHVRTAQTKGGSWNSQTGEVTEFEIIPAGGVIAREKNTAAIYITDEGGEMSAMGENGFKRMRREPTTPDYIKERGVPYCAREGSQYTHALNVGTVSSSTDPYATSD